MNKNTRKEIGSLMAEAAVSFFEVDGELRPVYTDESDYAITVLAIDSLTEKIIGSNEKLFALKTNKFTKQKFIAPTKTGSGLLSALKSNVPGIRSCFCNHEFSPRFELFVKHAIERDLDYWLTFDSAISEKDVTKACDILNGFVNAVREEGRRASFNAKLRRFQRSADKNNLSLYRYLRRTLAKNSKINVRRYDLAYQKEGAWPTQKACSVTSSQAKEHREALIKAAKKDLIGKHLIGYAWKMDHSAPRGFQHHLLLVLDEESAEEQLSVDAALKHAWGEATGGKGLLVDCNNLYPAFKSHGIGLIDDDKAAWSVFRNICIQMTQADNFIKLSLPGTARAFGKAELIDKKTKSEIELKVIG